METPTYNCYIHGETDDTYTVDVDCRCGKIHYHGVYKDQINETLHEAPNCDKFSDGYYIILKEEEVNRWQKSKK